MVVAAILAGGYGKRLKPLTEEIPKPLVEIKRGYTILDKQILDYKHAGIKEVYLLVSYRWDKINARYGDMWKGMKIHYLVEEEPHGTLYAIKNFLSEINEDALVSNGDIVADFNLREMIDSAKRNEDALITIAVTKMRSPYGIIEFKGGRIISFKEKPILDHYINAGFYFIKKEAYKYFEMRYKEKAVEKTVFPLLAKEGSAFIYCESDIFWQSVDNLKDLENVKEEFRNREDYPWGYEKLKNENKVLYIKKHYPPPSVELTSNDEIRVKRGQGILISENEKKILDAGEKYRVKKGRYEIHPIENLLIEIHQSR